MDRTKLNRQFSPVTESAAPSKELQQDIERPKAANKQSPCSAELEVLANSKRVTNNRFVLSKRLDEGESSDTRSDPMSPFNPSPSAMSNRRRELNGGITSQPNSNSPNNVWFVKKKMPKEDSDNQLPVYETTDKYHKFGGPAKQNVKPGPVHAPYFPKPTKAREVVDDYNPYGGIPDFHDVPIPNAQPSLQTRQPAEALQKPQHIIEAPEIKSESEKNILPPMLMEIKMKPLNVTKNKIECVFEIPDPKREGKTKQLKIKFSLKSWGTANKVKRATLNFGDAEIKKLSPDVLAQSLKLASQRIGGQGVTRVRLKKPTDPIKESASRWRVPGDDEKNSVTILTTDLSRAMDDVIASHK
jgi:hypothetical protein